MRSIAKVNDPTQREIVITKLFNSHFDFDAFYQRALFDHWKDWDEKKRQQFASSFRPLFIQNAARKFNRLLGKLDRSMKHSAAQTNWGYKVSSQTNIPKGTLTISSYLKKIDKDWKIMDLDIEGALLSRQYRGQFNNILRRFGYAELIKRIEDKKT